MSSHTGKPYLCGYCGKRFMTSGNRTAHMRLHKQSPCHCDVCGMYFSHSSHLVKHIRSHKGYKCIKCGEVFANSQMMRLHIKEHENEERHLCEQCGKEFSNALEFRAHTKIHTHRCKQCGKEFSNASELQAHAKTYTECTPYQCKQCGMTFTKFEFLKVHSSTHTGGDPYICQVCGLRYTTYSGLVLHMGTHLTKKPYSCQQCGAGFDVYSEMNIHMMIHMIQNTASYKQCQEVPLTHLDDENPSRSDSHVSKDSSVKDSDISHVSKHSSKVDSLGGKDCHVSRDSHMRNRHVTGGNPSTGENQEIWNIYELQIKSSDKVLSQNITEFIDSDRFTLQPIFVNVLSSSPFSLPIFKHPNIAVTYGVTMSGGQGMLVIEKVQTSLSELLAEVGHEMTVRERVNVCYGIVCAVDYLHHHVEIFHGYIKCDSVFVTPQFTAKLLDPSAAFLMHNKMCQRAESFADDLHQLTCLLVTMLCDTCSPSTSGNKRLRNLISGRDKKGLKDVMTSEALQILEELKRTEEYRNSPRNRELVYSN